MKCIKKKKNIYKPSKYEISGMGEKNTFHLSKAPSESHFLNILNERWFGLSEHLRLSQILRKTKCSSLSAQSDSCKAYLGASIRNINCAAIKPHFTTLCTTITRDEHHSELSPRSAPTLQKPLRHHSVTVKLWSPFDGANVACNLLLCHLSLARLLDEEKTVWMISREQGVSVRTLFILLLKNTCKIGFLSFSGNIWVIHWREKRP